MTCPTRHGADCCFLCLRVGVDASSCSSCSICFGHRGDPQADGSGHLPTCASYAPFTPTRTRTKTAPTPPGKRRLRRTRDSTSPLESPVKHHKSSRRDPKPKQCASCGRDGASTRSCSDCLLCQGHVGDLGADASGHASDCVLYAGPCLCGYPPTSAADRAEHRSRCHSCVVPAVPVLGDTTGHARNATQAMNKVPGRVVCVCCNVRIGLRTPGEEPLIIDHHGQPPPVELASVLSAPANANLPTVCKA